MVGTAVGSWYGTGAPDHGYKLHWAWYGTGFPDHRYKLHWERWYDVGDPDYVVLHKIWAMRTTTGKEGHSEDNPNALGNIIKKQKNESIMIIKKK